MLNRVAKFLIVLMMSMPLANCQDPGILTVIADLPTSLKENSGMATYDGKSVWLIEDSGNGDNIYKVGLDGKIIKRFDVKDAKNQDWEDLTKDKKGNLYIRDFGNNRNDRKNLVIYKLPNPEVEKGDKIDAEKIEFKYPEQKEFPPKKSKLYYDTEAFFHWGDHLYIITKNRTEPFDGKARIYKVPDKKGKYKAQLVAEWTTCPERDTCIVTSAEISDDGKTIAVLGYGTLWLITDFELDDFSKGSIKQIDLKLRTQLESVCFKDANTLLLSDERSRMQGRNLYLLKLDGLR